MKLALSFDDVLLVPRRNNISSRDLVDTTTTICKRELKIPIIAANMPSVCGAEMAIAMNQMGGLGIIHRMCSVEEQAEMVGAAREACEVKGSNEVDGAIGAAIGIGDDWESRSRACIEAGANFICIDVAHGDQQRVASVAKSFLESYINATGVGLIIGNIATNEAAQLFVEEIPDRYHEFVALKVGVGGGSVCVTRIQTGFGVPTLQSVLDVGLRLDAMRSDMTIIADGGIKNSGDICKSLAGGAHAVMLGSLLAGTDEAPGDVVRSKDGLHKIYAGSASHGAKKKFFGKAEYVEGAERLVPYKGSAAGVVTRLMEGVRSGFTYAGAPNLSTFQAVTKMVQITSAGYQESLPHGLL